MEDADARLLRADGRWTMTDTLTRSDVDRLLADPSPGNRADMAAKVAREFRRGNLTGEERRIAEAIVRAMAQDAVVRVRKALAEHLKESNSLPPDVAKLLAADVEAVAIPVLQYSTVLSDEDLVAFVKGATSEKLKAIASRRTVSAPVSDAVVRTDDAKAIAALVEKRARRSRSRPCVPCSSVTAVHARSANPWRGGRSCRCRSWRGWCWRRRIGSARY